MLDEYKIIIFDDMSDSMKWGVYQDYFDSVGIIIDLQPICNYNNKHYTSLLEYNFFVFALNHSNTTDFGSFKTRAEARTAAIEKANEIRNKQLND